MAVGPVTINGVIQRTQDIGMLKQQEESKPFVEQQNIQTHLKTQEQRQAKQVNHADDAREHEKRYDAKEKGSNEYEGQQKKKKQSDENGEGKVFLKQGNSRFDIKI